MKVNCTVGARMNNRVALLITKGIKKHENLLLSTSASGSVLDPVVVLVWSSTSVWCMSGTVEY